MSDNFTMASLLEARERMAELTKGYRHCFGVACRPEALRFIRDVFRDIPQNNSLFHPRIEVIVDPELLTSHLEFYDRSAWQIYRSGWRSI